MASRSNRWLPRAGWLAAALVMWTTGAAVAQDGVRVVTLDEAIDRALRVDPAAIAAEGAVRSARAGVQQAAGAWLPSLNLNSGYANSSNERFDQSTGRLVSENYTAQLAAGIDVFTGGRRVAQQRGARAELGAAGAQERAQHFQTVLSVTDGYYAAAAAAELVGSAEQRLERARKQLSFAKTRLEVGSATRSDVLRAELEVGNAELAKVDAESGLRTARLQLGRLLGYDEQVQPAPSALPEQAPSLPSAELLAARAEASSPAAVAAKASASARRTETYAAYTSYMPTLRLTGGYDWFSFDFPPDQKSWSYRLLLSFPIFNGFQREANVARARAAERTAEARAHDAAIGARIAAEDAAREIGAAEQRVQIAERTVELAREDLRVQEQRYQIGNSTILDLQASQIALADAEVAWVRARQALGTAVARLEAVLGETLDQMPTDPDSART
ncbi:MAG TPA: TolC family protein [Longimicrobiaceae bacterium]|jgi:outer membrane protein TolC|nr:TolC family protein [Longimicrobiaceae bacterium]